MANTTKKIYTVWDSRTDAFLVQGTADECAKYLGMSYRSFHCAVCRANKGIGRLIIDSVLERKRKSYRSKKAKTRTINESK